MFEHYPSEIEALRIMKRLVDLNSGASEAARSVLLYAWNNDNPIREFYKFDQEARWAAFAILDRPFSIEEDLVQSIVPDIYEWERESNERKKS